jgi:hypothetical protein
MTFIILTFIAAFLIEGLGTATSVIGLSALFGANPIIIALAIALDLGKIVVVSLLYKYWGKLGKVMKSYAFVAAFITMVITSAGAAGYLTGEFQKAIMGSQEGGLRVQALTAEQVKLEERKKQIDNQIASLPDKFSAAARIRMINQFKDEQKTVTARLTEIAKELPDLQVKQLGVEAKAGPILTIAKSFNISTEEAIKWVILMIIFVFDPLAIFLIISGNFLLDQRAKAKLEERDRLERAWADDPDRGNPSVVPMSMAMRPPEPAPVEIHAEPVSEPPFPYKEKPMAEEPPAPPVDEPDEPMITVLHPTPRPEPVIEPAPPPTPEVVAADPLEIKLEDLGPRTEITLDTIKGKHRSSLHDAQEADVEMNIGQTITDQPPSRVMTVYQGQRR